MRRGPHHDVLTAKILCGLCLRGSPFARVILRWALRTIAPRVECQSCGRRSR